MRPTTKILLISILSFAALTPPPAALAAPKSPQSSDPLIAEASRFIEAEDYLGFRVFLQRNFRKRLPETTWFGIRQIIQLNVDKIGFDWIYLWDRNIPPGSLPTGARLDVNETLFQADDLMTRRQFEDAFEKYQLAAKELDRLRSANIWQTSTRAERALDNITALYPYVLHSMARALYSAKRFGEAFDVFSWIKPTYPRYRQVLFDRMWAAFRAGYVDHALGAIASQRSAYFSRYTPTESYLVQVYLYKVLCRKDDLDQVVTEMRQFRTDLQDGKYSFADWIRSDIETRVLWKLIRPRRSELPLPRSVTNEQRNIVRTRIRSALEKMFIAFKTRTIEDIEVVLAYAQLTAAANAEKQLKPITKLPDREELFKMNLEIWPADSTEQWVDEIGTHRFIGESQCEKKS